MSKSIYEEALNILRDSLQDPQDEDDDCYLLDFEQMKNITKPLEQAQKQEKLLELYRQLVLDLDLVIKRDTTDDWNGPVDYEYFEINNESLNALNTYKQIKELEK